jgi:hypothetical protein
MSTVSTQIFSNCQVPAKSGTTVHIKPDQPVTYNGSNMLKLTGSKEVLVKIDGPRTQLNVDDIAGVYPAPGSEESADEFLPHISLTRRTLPWERFGIDNDLVKPWLALVVYSASELKLTTPTTPQPKGEPQAVVASEVAAKDATGGAVIAGKLGASTPLTVLYVRNDLWVNTRPHPDDLRYLTHIRSTTIGPQTKYTSAVICNRLPNAGSGEDPAEIHTACLISLEGRNDLFTRGSNTTGYAALVVLHYWKFRPSKGGDFEQVIRSIRLRPNGGVLRFGNLTATVDGPPTLSGNFDSVLDPNGYFKTPLPHTQEGDVTWRSPLRPFKAPQRSNGFAVRPDPEEFAVQPQDTPLDYSHATAFELGRLLTMSNTGLLEDLREITAVIPEIVAPPAINKMPKALQWPEWVSNPADQWYEQPWDVQNQSMLKDEVALLEGKVGDIGGINQLPGQWGSDPLIDLGQLPAANLPVVVAIDVNAVNVNTVGQIFADVESAAHGG